MFTMRESIGRSRSVTASLLALGACFAIPGCAESTGFRSIWPDRPSLLGLRDRRSQPTPDPADDYYARYMHLAQRKAADPAAASDQDGPPSPPEMLASGERLPSAAPSRAKGSRAPTGASSADDEVQVTLGMPEPMPSPAPLLAPDTRLASTRSLPERAESDESPDSGPPMPPDSPVLRREAGERLAQLGPGERPDRPARVESAGSPRPRRTGPTTPARPAAPDPRSLLAQSEARLRKLDTYQVKMSRVERVDGRLQPEEEVILSVHRQPREVRLEWASGASKGREVIYSTRVDDRTLYVHMPKTAIPLPTMKMAVDSPMVARSSRHSIKEAGLDTIVQNLRNSVDQVDAANAAQGRAVYRGREKPPGLDQPCHVFTRKSPNGETWTVFIDARTLLPRMVVAKDPKGQLDEKYIYHDVIENPAELAAADAFDPDRRWGSGGGLLSRFARGGTPANRPGDAQTTTR
ncbi:MAG: DUF1571 domain-containing protein [Isosphaeraceae bacterium]